MLKNSYGFKGKVPVVALTLVLIITLATITITAGQLEKAYAQIDLTGQWTSDDGGIYYIRQIGVDVYWFGQGTVPSTGQSFANVFKGTISGNTLSGTWADVPYGVLRNAGTLYNVEIIDNCYMELVSGDWGGTFWEKQFCN